MLILLVSLISTYSWHFTLMWTRFCILEAKNPQVPCYAVGLYSTSTDLAISSSFSLLYILLYAYI